MDLCALLSAELQQRRNRNPRYSLRAFARKLGTHHTALSLVLQRRRRLTPRAVRQLGRRLGLSPAQIADACLSENARSILHLVEDHRFRPDSRWIATMTGIPLDEVNRALHWLLHERRLTMASLDSWKGESVS
jgi:hypothetical protein